MVHWATVLATVLAIASPKASAFAWAFAGAVTSVAFVSLRALVAYNVQRKQFGWDTSTCPV